jgi:UDP-glucose 4-epimerase
VFASDVVSANIAALTRGSGEVYVIGAGRTTSVNQIYRALSMVMGFEDPITRAPRHDGDTRDIYFNPAKAKRELGWEAKVSLLDGMQATVDFLRAQTQEEAAV